MSARIRAHMSPPVPARGSSDPDVIRQFLVDAAHVPGGSANLVAFPEHPGEVAHLMRSHASILAVGAQSSLTGGATPRGGIVLSTRRMNGMSVGGDRVLAGAGVTLAALEQVLSSHGLWYPPVPTFDGATVGGTIATNAAGAATFKYGSTRPWVEALTVVLADGSVLNLRRGETVAIDGVLEIEHDAGGISRVPLPSYTMPAVAKHSGGFFSSPTLDAIDLFIGSEGTLGVITEAELRVIRRPDTTVALLPCASDEQAIAVTTGLRDGNGGAVAGVEYVDAPAIAQVGDEVFHRTGVRRPPAGAVFLLVQLEGEIEHFTRLLDAFGLADAASVAMAGNRRAAERLFELREAVPAAVNARVADAKARVDDAIEKTAGDMIVPFDRLAESLALYRDTFAQFGLDHAIWGHFSDGNLHPNVIPRSLDDVVKGKEALLQIGQAIVAMGGSPLAEHGVGRNPVKQELLRRMYGDAGIEQMRAVKRALDPEWKLAPGVVFPV